MINRGIGWDTAKAFTTDIYRIFGALSSAYAPTSALLPTRITMPMT